MKKFEINILGCASAKPSKYHHPSCQVVNYDERLFMIDCGEGTQTQFTLAGLRPTKLNHIFISHIHGDHIFGLYGLISTMNLMGRTEDLHMYVPKGSEESFEAVFKFHNPWMSYKIVFHPVDTIRTTVIYEDKSLLVESIPLDHPCACCGFLFKEKPQPPHIDKSVCDSYGIQPKELRFIKEGKDYVMPNGTIIPNSKLTTPGDPERSFAYCCDTAPLPRLKEQLQGVNLLCHEATYLAADRGDDSADRGHSTAADAAEMAKLYEAGELLITHFSTMYDKEENRLLEEAQTIFPPTVLASELLVVPVK